PRDGGGQRRQPLQLGTSSPDGDLDRVVERVGHRDNLSPVTPRPPPRRGAIEQRPGGAEREPAGGVLAEFRIERHGALDAGVVAPSAEQDQPGAVRIGDQHGPGLYGPGRRRARGGINPDGRCRVYYGPDIGVTTLAEKAIWSDPCTDA